MAVDRSEPSLRAVDVAAEMAQKFAAALMLVTAVRGIGPPIPESKPM